MSPSQVDPVTSFWASKLGQSTSLEERRYRCALPQRIAGRLWVGAVAWGWALNLCSALALNTATSSLRPLHQRNGRSGLQPWVS